MGCITHFYKERFVVRTMYIFLISFLLIACQDSSVQESVFIPALHEITLLELQGLPVVSGVSGNAGLHTPVGVKVVNNSLGFYEYLPKHFDKSIKNLPIVIYWNGQNAGAGNGNKDLGRLLTQGLPHNIDNGTHYPAIIISPMTGFKEWKVINVDPFIEFIIKRYKPYIDEDRLYMTGFSGGGGLTVRYATEHPERLAAIVPVSPAVKFPSKGQPSIEMSMLPSWFFHNEGDPTVSSSRSIAWHEKLLKKSPEHRLTVYKSESHYAWQAAYADQEMWKWLLSKRR
jgi:predicted peptidase